MMAIICMDRRYNSTQHSPLTTRDLQFLKHWMTGYHWLNWDALHLASSDGECHGCCYGDDIVSVFQFFVTLADDLDYLDQQGHTVFGEVSEGEEVLQQLNEIYCDREGHPFQNIRWQSEYRRHDSANVSVVKQLLAIQDTTHGYNWWPLRWSRWPGCPPSIPCSWYEGPWGIQQLFNLSCAIFTRILMVAGFSVPPEWPTGVWRWDRSIQREDWGRSSGTPGWEGG